MRFGFGKVFYFCGLPYWATTSGYADWCGYAVIFHAFPVYPLDPLNEMGR